MVGSLRIRHAGTSLLSLSVVLAIHNDRWPRSTRDYWRPGCERISRPGTFSYTLTNSESRKTTNAAFGFRLSALGFGPPTRFTLQRDPPDRPRARSLKPKADACLRG